MRIPPPAKQKTHPFVNVHYEIVKKKTEASNDSNATINLATLTQQSLSLKTTADREKSIQEATRARHLHNEKLAVIELYRGELTMRALYATQEILREYLNKKTHTNTNSVGR